MKCFEKIFHFYGTFRQWKSALKPALKSALKPALRRVHPTAESVQTVCCCCCWKERLAIPVSSLTCLFSHAFSQGGLAFWENLLVGHATPIATRTTRLSDGLHARFVLPFSSLACLPFSCQTLSTRNNKALPLFCFFSPTDCFIEGAGVSMDSTRRYKEKVYFSHQMCLRFSSLGPKCQNTWPSRQPFVSLVVWFSLDNLSFLYRSCSVSCLRVRSFLFFLTSLFLRCFPKPLWKK